MLPVADGEVHMPGGAPDTPLAEAPVCTEIHVIFTCIGLNGGKPHGMRQPSARRCSGTPNVTELWPLGRAVPGHDGGLRSV